MDGDSAHPYYRYGGAWKNKFAGVSAKKPKKGKAKGKGELGEWTSQGIKYTKNDRVMREGRVWICRKSHQSREGDEPEKAIALWKEDDTAGTTGEDSAGTG